MDVNYRQVLLRIAAEYAERARQLDEGLSLATIATKVANSSTVFDRLGAGKDVNVSTLERLLDWFRSPANWPGCVVPALAADALASIGRPALVGAIAADRFQDVAA